MGSACRSCQAPIQWAITETGKKVPLDAAPVEGGFYFRFRDPGGSADFYAKKATPERIAKFPDAPRFESHFRTCPNATQHSRGSR